MSSRRESKMKGRNVDTITMKSIFQIVTNREHDFSHVVTNLIDDFFHIVTYD